MTKAIVTMMLAAASMQAETLIAKVNFPFAASGVKMAAGEYRVAPLGENGLVTVENRKTGEKVVLKGFNAASVRDRALASSHLQFACAGGECVVTQVWINDRGLENRKVRRDLESTSGPVQVATVAMARK